MDATNQTETRVHPFEASGLGKAPFRYVGMVHQEISHGRRVLGTIGGFQVETKPGGTCDHCGAYIVNMFTVESADGRRFKVGSDCIRKVDAKLAVRVKADVKKAKADLAATRIERAKQALPDVAEGLASKPHPNAELAKRGLTLLSFVEWMFRNAGMTGKTSAAKIVERETKKGSESR